MHRTIVLLPLLAGLLIAAQPKEAKTDADKIQGTWKAVAGEENGEKTPADKLKVKVIFKDRNWKLELQDGTKIAEGVFKLDSSQKPKTLDLTPTVDGNALTTIKSIYKFEGDDLVICGSDERGAERPKEFASKKGSGVGVRHWKREKP